MDITASCPLAQPLAERIREDRSDLTRRWLERIAARVSIAENRIFPSQELLDHVPMLLEGIAAYLADPVAEITTDGPVIAKAMELGSLRLEQGFDAHEILKEYEILGGVLFNFVACEAAKLNTPCSEGELIIFTHRLFRAISVIEQATTSQYLRSLNERVNEREERLRRFNRMVSHELKNKVGAVLGAGELLQEEWISSEERTKFSSIVVENARGLQQVLENLTELSRLESEVRLQRNIMLREAVSEVLRQQRELARAREVQLQVADLPRVEVNAAAVELCLSNYISNAIKYSNPDVPVRWVKIDAELQGTREAQPTCMLVVRVQDNGLGVPAAARERLFQRFYRSTATAGLVDGTGIGLSLVRETVEAIGGSAWAEFAEGTTTFFFAMPCRRRNDAPVRAELLPVPG